MRGCRDRGGGTEGGGGGVAPLVVPAEPMGPRKARPDGELSEGWNPQLRISQDRAACGYGCRARACGAPRNDSYAVNGSFSPSGRGISNAFSVTETRL